MADGILTSIDPGRRVGQAAQLIGVGDLPGAWSAILRPDELTPQERDALLGQWRVQKGPYEAAFRVLTNPLMLASFALSYVFPIASARNILGLSKKMSGLTSKLPIIGRFASYRSIFRGTPIPETINKFTGTRQEFLSRHLSGLGKSFEKFEAAVGRAPNSREQVMMSGWFQGLHKGLPGFEALKVGPLLPNLEGAMSRPLRTLVGEVETHLGALQKEVFTGGNRTAMVKGLKRLRGMGYGDEVSEVLEEWATDPGRAGLMPKRAVHSEEGFRAIMGALLRGKTTDKKSTERIVQWMGKRQEARKYGMVPSLQDLDEVRDLIDPAAYGKMTDQIKATVLAGAKGKVRESVLRNMKGLPVEEVLGNYTQYMQGPEAGRFALAIADHLPHHYSLKAVPVIERYVHDLSTTYAWSTKGHGERMFRWLSSAERLGATDARAAWRANELRTNYIPMMLGRLPPRQALRSQLWSQSIKKLSLRLDHPTFKSVMGPNMVKYLQDRMQDSRGALSLLNLNRKTTSYFFINTLGLNPASAIKNIFELLLTTGPVVGTRTMVAGVGSAMSKSRKYFSMRLSRGANHDEALMAAFPDFAKAGITGAPITSEALENAFQNAYNIASLPTAKGVSKAGKIGRAMMAMFSVTENAKRLASYEAFMIHGRRAGLKGPQVAQFANDLFHRTQVLSGPLTGPAILMDKSPLVRQFLNFPAQTLEFVTDTALTLGSGQKNWLGYNPGTLARMVAGSMLAFELGDALGVNTGDALMGGAFPTFSESGPFAPIPVVPPAIQLLGAVGLGIAKGDFQEAIRSTPLLVPGGVQAYRAMGLLPPGIPGSEWGKSAARWAGRTYADYQSPAPDGRIAVFSGQNTLKGYFRPWEIVAMGLGIKAGGPEREREVLQLLVANRDLIKQYRKDAIQALLVNDPGEVLKLQRGFEERFGFPLPLSADDVKVAQARRRMSRVEQVYQTLPPEARPTYQRVIEAAFGAEFRGLLGIDPGLLSQPPVARAAARPGGGAGVSQVPSSYLNQLGPLDRLDPYRIGRTRNVPTDFIP